MHALLDHSQQELELKFNNPAEPTYDNAQEILMFESTQAKGIKTETCVAYASVTKNQ